MGTAEVTLASSVVIEPSQMELSSALGVNVGSAFLTMAMESKSVLHSVVVFVAVT